MNCPRCQSELLPKAKFCRKCGTPTKHSESTALMTESGLEQGLPVTDRAPIFDNCPNCGTPHNQTERFCQRCNHDFSPHTNLISTPPNIPMPIITGEGLANPTLPQTQAVYTQNPLPVQKRRSPIVAILLVLIALLGVGGVLGFFYLQTQKPEVVEKPTSTQYPASTTETQTAQRQDSNTAAVKPPETKTKPVETQPSKTDVTGRWISADNDIIDLKQAGTSVTGTYKGGKAFQGMTGTFKGTFDGKNFVGTYLHHYGNYQIRGKLRVAMTDGGQLVGTWIASDGNSGAYVLTRAKS